MTLDLSRSIQTQSIRWLPLDHLVDEVGSLDRPSFGYLVSLDLNLLCQDMVANFLPGLSEIGPL